MDGTGMMLIEFIIPVAWGVLSALFVTDTAKRRNWSSPATVMSMLVLYWAGIVVLYLVLHRHK